jgi:Flp pilus assembly protein TadB
MGASVLDRLSDMNIERNNTRGPRIRIPTVILVGVLGLAAVVTIVWTGTLVWLVLHALNML